MKTVNYFKALSDETRLKILYLLMRHELNVNEIVATMGMGQSRISRHLKILTDTGLLTLRRDGLWAFYKSAVNGRGNEIINSLKAIMSSDPELEKDIEKFEEILENRTRERTEFFNSIAPGLDRIKREIFGDFNINKEILDRIEDKKYEIAADLGCGTGELISHLALKVQKVIGVDRSPNMLDKAMEILSGYGHRVDLRIGSIEHLPMRDKEADIVIINMVLHYLASPVNGLIEACRVLKKRGRLILIDLNKHKNEKLRSVYEHRWLGFSAQEMEQLFKSSNFSLIEKKQFPAEHRLKINLFTAVKN